jgi:hypothetical protein
MYSRLKFHFQDIREDHRLFGGITVCFYGNFRQICPVIKKGSHARIVGASLKRSLLWHKIIQVKLTINMRLFNNNSLHDRNRLQEFADRILAVGQG